MSGIEKTIEKDVILKVARTLWIELNLAERPDATQKELYAEWKVADKKRYNMVARKITRRLMAEGLTISS